MKTEEILSAGIDIGTSTTQLIFSRLTLRETSGFGRIPQTEIVSKEVFYRSPIHFTPLLGDDRIDGEKTAKIIGDEYKAAGIEPSMLSTGAVIITGESNRKKNAREVIDAISSFAGDFVAAAAGPDLESVLAGKGSGAETLSAEKHCTVLNIDIGGGTSNLCCFRNGETIDTACLDIGGRQIRISDGIISYIAPKTKALAERHSLYLRIGCPADRNILTRLCDLYADILAQACNLKPKTDDLYLMMTNKLLSQDNAPTIITLSGGVAACLPETRDNETDWMEYGDIGPLLAEAISHLECRKQVCIYPAAETVRATVIGAGNYSTAISGSTIDYSVESFPVRNIPVGKIILNCSEDISHIPERIEAVLETLDAGHSATDTAIAFEGIACPSFSDIQGMAEKIMNACDSLMEPEAKCILITKSDIGKALGQALRRVNINNRELICIDQIRCNTGDFIDIGRPLASGTVIPVIVKTLVFG